MLRQLSFIPLPLRILGVLLIGIVVAGMFGGGSQSSGPSFGGIGSIATLVAVFFWLIVAVAIMYEIGWLNALSKVPLLSSLLGFLTSRAAAGATNAISPEAGPRGKLSEEDRFRIEAEATSALNRLVGVESARKQIEQRLLDPLSGDPDSPFGTQAPAVVAVFAGPRGVGMTTAAIATGQILAGRGALDTANVVTVRDVDLRSGEHGTPSAMASSMAQRALGGTLLLEGAGWLMASDPYSGGTGPGADFGVALLEFIQRHPHKIFIAMTVTREESERLSRQPETARWLGKLAVRTIIFEDIDDDSLLDILETRLGAAGWSLADDAAAVMARRTLAELRERAGDAFDNSEACRRMAETLIEIARSEGSPQNSRERIIDREIIRLADDQLE
ncbi:hypothetical protein [Neorhizobium sp. LjRoot104]|uniref:hypothetical protein n=1 Tax=Neorhizobium sp. LjRoot104 TaxID=3342254 RepID=UPI003ECF703C